MNNLRNVNKLTTIIKYNKPLLYNCTNCLNNYYVNFKQITKLSTYKSQLKNEESFLKKIMKNFTFFNQNKHNIKYAGYILYEQIVDKLNYNKLFTKLNLPDTFYSWFVITELHIWMLSCRVMANNNDGKLLRNSILQALWSDVDQRVKKLGINNSTLARKQISELSEQLQAALIAYDEGLQMDDMVLAGALWRRFYQQNDVDIRCLDFLVHYIRKQIRFLDQLNDEQLINKRSINWNIDNIKV